MRMKLTAILLLFCVPIIVHAHEEDTTGYHIQHFTDENGLPQNSVKFIAPDGAGFLWLATENGLVRFEGTRFRSFGNSRISYIYPGNGRKGLFARTEKHQVLSIKNGYAEEYKKVPASPDKYEYLVYHDTVGVYPVTGLPNIFAGLINSERYVIPISAQAFFRISRDSIAYIRKGNVQYAFAYRNHSPWTFFTIGRKLYHMPAPGKFVTFNMDTVQQVPVTGGLNAARGTSRLYWNYVAEQLFLYQDKKCYYMTVSPEGGMQTREIVGRFDFDRNNIISVYYDEEQERVFMGSRSKGLYIYTRKHFHPFISPDEQNNVFYAQAPYGDSGIVTAQGIVFGRNGRAEYVDLMKSRHAQWDRYSMLRDEQGCYWYKNKSTVYRYDPKITKVLWSFSFEKDEVTQLYLGYSNRLWIGTKNAGLYSLDASAPDPVLYSGDVKDASFILHEIPELLWVGGGKGLVRIHLPSRHIDTLSEFNDRYIRSLFIPAKDEVWITTYDSGFFLYRQNKLISLPKDKLDYLNTAHCIAADDRGFFWIPTNKGLFQAARADLMAYAEGRQDYVYYLYYAKEHGFLTNEFNGGCQPCALKLQDGRISLPAMEGLVQFSPADVRPELPKGPLIIDQVMLDNQAIAVGDTVNLPNQFLRLALHVSTPYFGDGYNVQMDYALVDGAGKVWLPVEDKGVISFSGMHSGEYKLHIRKINGFGLNNYSEKIITLIVRPAWFETAWFRVAAIFLLGLLIFVYVRWRVKYIHHKNQMLQQRVEERTRELQETLLFLQASEQQLHRKSQMQQHLITAITHDIKTPMKYLLLLSSTTAQQDRRSGAMHESVYRMYHLVENLIQYMKMQVMDNHAAIQHVDLYELLEEKAGIFRPIAESRAIRIYNNTSPDLKVPVNRQLLAIVVNNLLDNAVKYTTAGYVGMAASCEDGVVSIRISDTGIGMSPEMRDWINGNGRELSDEKWLLSMQQGVGLMIVLELLQQINGKLVVHANEDAGTRMEILLRLN
ncbi:ATP-binding protein [Chitinophaga sp. XS-30]|uniref:sensor histidine kinase n=1 Tax=Chitinophaga sp. XS-30 TaxID=2604421 RepID=UPI0011DCDBD7|nr:ATP-binding protein [Chitinophaga sp. XS-30]QEH43085.1 hypothetical protein FW415_20325 [Chitinophaga sp. XS-30]